MLKIVGTVDSTLLGDLGTLPAVNSDMVLTIDEVQGNFDLIIQIKGLRD